jgi:C_GCAxxG_C_C family probable redox protein
MEKQEIALTNFTNKNNCCQSVISAFINDFNLDKETTLKLATGFGGGMCKGEVCGAVTGAYMALGLKFGYTSQEDFEGKAITKEKVLDFDKQFINKHDTLHCKELLDCDITTPEGREYAAEHNLFQTKCTAYIKDAVSIADGLIYQ